MCIFESPYRFLALVDDRATIDFEARSVSKIKICGGWRYSRDPSTEILCLAFRLPGDLEPSLWHGGYHDDETNTYIPAGMLAGSRRVLEDLFDHIRAGGLVEAHNAFFERAMWENIFSKPTPLDEFGLPNARRGVNAPPIKLRQWRCSAAKASAFGLPRALGEACNALFHEALKDEEGATVMKRLCKPRPVRKSDEPGKVYWFNDTVSFLRLFLYCMRDVIAEHRLSTAIPDLSPTEYKVWLADFKANWRGVRVDLGLCHAAIKLDTEIKRKWNKELHGLTGIESGTLRAQCLEWLNSQGLHISDSKAETLDWLEKHDPEWANYPPEVRRVVFIVRNINRTSTAKFKRVLQMVDLEDDRVRDLVMYHGAHTGRWSGRGIQVQNFPRGHWEKLDGSPLTMAEAVEMVYRCDVEEIEAVYGDVLLLLSSVARGLLLPSEGRVLLCADYAAIEARVVLWLAGCEEALDVFRRGEDLYCDMASSIYRRHITKADKTERFFGKTAILSLGFGVGFLSFCLRLRMDVQFTEPAAREILGKQWTKYTNYIAKIFDPQPEQFHGQLWKYDTPQKAEHAYRMALLNSRQYKKRLETARLDWRDISHELALCKMVVDKYRERFAPVCQLWFEQEQAAIQAIKFPGTEHTAGMCIWKVEEDRLFCQLPSGRHLTYTEPRLRNEKTPWGETQAKIYFKGMQKTGAKKWGDLHTYGASLVENITQACARDVMAYAFVRADEKEDYTPITTVHDELINEVDEEAANMQEFGEFMTQVPPAFMLCPIAADSAMLHRYQK